MTTLKAIQDVPIFFILIVECWAHVRYVGIAYTQRATAMNGNEQKHNVFQPLLG